MNKKVMRISLIPLLVSIIMILASLAGLIIFFSKNQGQAAEAQMLARNISIFTWIILAGLLTGFIGLCMFVTSFFLKGKPE